MSKIFDALRKAEREKRGPARSMDAVRTASTRTARSEEEFLSGLGENFKRSLFNLRNSIESSMRQKSSRLIMFTSANRDEGKTTIAVFLARALAGGSAETVLAVDCAVLHPQLHELFGVRSDPGIIDYLSGTAELSAIAKPVRPGVLDVVPIGAPLNAGVTQPLFHSERMGRFVREAAEKYDYVVVDTSAILESPETSIIGAYMDGIVLVVHAGKTKREVVRRAMMMVQKLDGTFIGTVLNRKKYYIPDFIYRRV
jgi:protein-tyrosine kinase